MKINSISRKLVLTIVIPVIAILMTLGVLNYWNTKGIINQLNASEQKFTIDEIKSFIELQFVALDIIEEPIQQQMEVYSTKIIDTYYSDTTNIANINLNKIRDDLGMDAASYDLYVINTNGEVINTTYLDDLGINLFNFGDIYKKYLQGILNEGKFDSPKFFFENKTKKYKKYSYQATKDKKYIIEIGFYSNQADRIFDYMINHLEKIAEQRINLSTLDLFFWLETPTSLNPEKEFIAEHLRILPDLEAGETVSLLNEGSENTNYTYVYVKNINSKLIRGAIVRLTHDSKHQKNFVKKEMLKFAAVLIVALLLTVVIAFLINPIGKVIKNITRIAKELAIGNLSVKIDPALKNRNDELGDLSTAIDTLITGLVQTSEFARQTGKGNFDEKYNLLSEKDVLGQTLMKMQERLTRAKIEEEKTSEEEKKNKFTADGLAQFGEILRSNNNDISELCNRIMQGLVDYLDIPMGALFVAEKQDNEITLEAKATVAYSRIKVLNKKIKLSEGLIGRCAFERLPIYLTEIPQDYIEITSGLGTANPSNILLVPLISENEVFGVIEIASFNEIEAHKIAFTEKLAESIASTLSTVQINQKTVQLLEQSKTQSEELASQEEEMRQNMEELIATQEEAVTREEKLSRILHAVEASVFKTEYNMAGVLQDINEKYLTFLQINSNLLLDKHYNKECEILGIEPSELDPIWVKLQQGIPQEIKIEVTPNKQKCYIKEYYWPITDSNSDAPNKIIKVSHLC
ncbi:MAG: GAF domain-containing protein [Salinivirgaceae bacterium]|jgi:methyl-accepting chemotaxis protein|nr:GAF domain-containing protein [Salinivirgaceae bacterium]